MKTWSFFFFLTFFLYSDAHGNLCQNYRQITGGSCEGSEIGCDVTNAPCTSDGCKEKRFKSSTYPGGVISFCIDPEKEMNFLKVDTKVEEGCGQVRVEVSGGDGRSQYSTNGDPITLDTRPDRRALKRPIIIGVTGYPRLEDLGEFYVPPGPKPGPGDDVCTPPELYPEDKDYPPVKCDMGELPPLRLDGFPGWLGLRRVSIGHGATQTWCVKLDKNVKSWKLAIVDRTGAAQCFYHFAEFTPPAGSSLESKSGKGGSTGTALTFRSQDDYLPKGTWQAKVTASDKYPNCNMQYEITVHGE